MGRHGWRAVGIWLVAVAAAVACAVADYGQDVVDQPEDARAEDAAASCDPGVCLRTCVGLGLAGGSCFDGECLCVSGDGPPPDVAGDTTGDTAELDDGGGADTPPPVCDSATCDSACRSIGFPGGNCVSGDCLCGGGADADADVITAEDAPVDDGPVDDGAVDDGPIDDGPIDDGVVDDAPRDDGAVEDAPVDETTVEDAPVDDGTADDAGGTWGVPVCDTTGGTLSDRGLFGGATRLVRTVSVPALGNGRAVRLEITISSRRFLIASLPFDDIQATLQSPGGVNRKFWYHFDGDTSGMLGDYTFFTPWVLPVWWDAAVGGTWTLTLQDDAFSGAGTTLVSWCVAPLDPAAYASTDTGARLASCDSTSRSISDYACASDGTDCEHPLTVQMQVTNLVRASGAPSARIETTHGDASQLRITLIGADGSETTLWNRGAGPLPATIPISTMSGAWMTGRYQLTITDMAAGTSGTLTRFCIEAN
ncbi:MAG: hypothetical protein HY905_06550 [Deltaproteobacteria bacterium]|nr:hypothetical protein [Deltaproteobacteria bacterium]